MFENGEVSLKIQQGQMLIDFKGKLTGEQLSGKLKVPSPAAPPDGIPLELKRGEYKVTAPPLKLSAEAFAALKGRWQGAMDVPMPAPAQGGAAATPTSVKVDVIARFETNARGEYIGYLAVVEPGKDASNTPGFVISEAQFADGKLAMKIPAANIEYSGEVAGKTLAGTWKQAALGRNIPLTLTRQ